MNAMHPEFEADDSPSLDKSLQAIGYELATAGGAAMQILVFQMQAATQEEDVVPPEEFMQAKSELDRAHQGLGDLEHQRLGPHGIEWPEDLATVIERVIGDLGELMHILDRCSRNKVDGIHGFNLDQNLYGLCCTRVAKALNAVRSGLAGLFLDLSQKERVDDPEKTNRIGQEIGRIGRVINMVATNPSIEAARVGDAGKGFTVIADEVKTLSTRVSSLSVSLTDGLS